MRVVVALDIDGVLNARCLDGRDYTLTIPMKDVPRSAWASGRGTRDLIMTVRTGSRHGEWVNSLLERGAEVVWATTWERSANLHFGPLIGVPELPLAVNSRWYPAESQHIESGSSWAWKVASLERGYGNDVALVMVDDGAPEQFHENSRRRHPVPIWAGHPKSLVLAPDPLVGLTDELMALIDTWVDEALAL